jgi:hypothetical protein
MRQFTIAATVAIATLVAAGPASAERINGGPLKQNGQCWRSHGGASEAAWGFWEPCAQPASTSTTHATHQTTRHHT